MIKNVLFHLRCARYMQKGLFSSHSPNTIFEIAKHNNFIQNVICRASFGFCSTGQ